MEREFRGDAFDPSPACRISIRCARESGLRSRVMVAAALTKCNLALANRCVTVTPSIAQTMSGTRNDLICMPQLTASSVQQPLRAAALVCRLLMRSLPVVRRCRGWAALAGRSRVRRRGLARWSAPGGTGFCCCLPGSAAGPGQRSGCPPALRGGRVPASSPACSASTLTGRARRRRTSGGSPSRPGAAQGQARRSAGS